MPDQAAKERAQARRIEEYSKTVYGDGDYNIEVETDDHMTYFAYVHKDLGFSFGDMLTNSGVWNSENRAVDELEWILAIESKHALSGVAMTKEELVSCYGVKTGRVLHKLNQLLPGYVEPAKPSKVTDPMIKSFLKACRKEARNPVLR